MRNKTNIELLVGVFLTLLGWFSILIQMYFAILIWTDIDRHSNSKLWYIVFDDKLLNLKYPFGISCIIFLIGLILLFKILFSKVEKPKK